MKGEVWRPCLHCWTQTRFRGAYAYSFLLSACSGIHRNFRKWVAPQVYINGLHRICRIGKPAVDIVLLQVGWVLECALPQGSTLSPSLWNIYVFDLELTDHICTQYIYVDDTSFFIYGCSWEEVVEGLNRAAENVWKYCSRWRIKVNVSKCKVLGFSPGGSSPAKTLEKSVWLNGENVTVTTSYRFLCIVFDERLSFGPQCTEIRRRIRQ